MLSSGNDNGPFLGKRLRVLDSIASWCGALHGSMHLSDAVGAIVQAVDAEVGVLSRDSMSMDQARVVASFDGTRAVRGAETVKRAYARDVLGLYHNNARKGTSWLLSELQDDRNFKKTSDLSSWRLSRGIIDIVVVVLDATGVQHDFLELHFVKPLNREAKELLDSLFPTLVRAWARRKSGLVTQAQIDDRIIVARANAEARRIKPDEAILGISNPARLSRAEFRVCLLMSRGLSIKGVTDELGLSESTIRSHLRSIYSKTAVTGVAELVYRLVSNTADDRPASHRSI